MSYRRRRSSTGERRGKKGKICEICQKEKDLLGLRDIYRCVKCRKTVCEQCLEETGYMSKELGGLKKTAFCPNCGERMAKI
ncbi:MAG: hypothetical protein ACFFCD_13595 [Promethearchaeota archaeon]